MKHIIVRSVLFLTLCICLGLPAQAQMPVPPPAPAVTLRSSAELDQMLGPIALYPDPLVAEILPAATLPSEIVLADRYLSSGGDPNLVDQQPWDPSIKALTRYPAILKWMDDNLAWSTAVGQAFLYQQQDVMDSIQRLRAQAQALGNLQTTPQQNVIIEDGNIEILPANPQVIYLPVYQPQLVYYQRPFGQPLITFGAAFPLGVWLNHDFDWHDHHLIVWHHDQPRPANWWFHRPGERPRLDVIGHAPAVWQPRRNPDLDRRDIDRGWSSHEQRTPTTVIGSQARFPDRRDNPARPERRTEPVVTQRPGEDRRSRPANGALIGVESSRDTRQFSNRGHESRQMAPARPSAAPSPGRESAPSRTAAPSRSTSSDNRDSRNR